MSLPNLLDNGGPELTGAPGRPVVPASQVQPVCFADRWWGHRSGDTGYSIATLGGGGFPNQIALQRSPGNGSTSPITVGQSTGVAAVGLSTLAVVSRLLVPALAGLGAQTLVFSVYARRGANFSGSGVTLQIVTATSDVNICGGAWTVEAAATFPAAQLAPGWTRFQVTKSGAWGGGGAQVLGVRVRFEGPSGAAGADDTLYLTGAKLELSNTGAATAYAMPTLHESLARCRRFWQAFGGVGEIAASGFCRGGMMHQFTHLLPVEMIKAPAASKTGTWFASNCSQPVVVTATARAFVLTTTSGIQTGAWAYRSDSADDLLVFDAETP
jgi:hypothetical protein